MEDVDALRIRLEGGLEILEASFVDLEELSAHAHEGWERQADDVSDLVEAWKLTSVRREGAIAAARRLAEAHELVHRWDDAASRLSEKLGRVLAHTAAARVTGLEQRLVLWGELARNVGPLPDPEPLARGKGHLRSREWLWSAAASVVVIGLGQPLLALVLGALGVVWWDLAKTRVEWRIFRDCVELEEENQPVRRVPFATLEGVSHSRAGYRLRGLWDLSLTGDDALFDFAVRVRNANAAVLGRTSRPRREPVDP